jgi:hypothetical protein
VGEYPLSGLPTRDPYNNGVRDIYVRLWDNSVVLMDGAHVVGDGDDDSYVVRVDPSQLYKQP